MFANEHSPKTLGEEHSVLSCCENMWDYASLKSEVKQSAWLSFRSTNASALINLEQTKKNNILTTKLATHEKNPNILLG